MDNKRLITFWLDIKKHQRFKTKTASEKTSITQILTKAVDAYIGKSEDVAEIIAGDKGRLEAGYEVTKRDKTNGDITQVDLKEISVMPDKTDKEKKLEALRDLIGGVPQNSPAEIQDIPAEDFPEEEEVSYTPDKQ